MLITPAILALHLITLGVTGTLLVASGFAVQILRHWDLQSSSEQQIRLERQTYLISTLVGFALAAEVLSLVLFVDTAENLSSQFVGAMCATGVFNINAFGFPTLFLKIAIFFLATLWLLFNRLDNCGYDYPLVRVKYGLLLAITPLTLLELITQTRYLIGLEPEVITSCCGSLFSSNNQGAAADLAGLPPVLMLVCFYTTAVILVGIGLGFWRWPGWGPAFGLSCVLGFGIALAAMVSFLSLYVYESPHHHCPFCLLKAGYSYVGYGLYLPLFVGTAAGLGAGCLAPFRHIASLQAVAINDIKQLMVLALLSFSAFYALASWVVLRSALVLF